MFTREDRRDAIRTLSALADNCEDAIEELARYARNMNEDDAEATQHTRAMMKIAADEFEMARRSLVMAKAHVPDSTKPIRPVTYADLGLRGSWPA